MRRTLTTAVAAAVCAALSAPMSLALSAQPATSGASLEVVSLGSGLSQQHLAAISADGSTIVGAYRTGSGGLVSFGYRPGRGGLWFLPPGFPSRPVPGGLNADGSRIAVSPVGQIGVPRTAGVLDRNRGDVAFIVPGMGEPGASDSVGVRALSNDGQTLVGSLSRLVPVPGGRAPSRTTWIYSAGNAERHTVSWLVRGRVGLVRYDQCSPVAASADASRVLIAVEPPLPTFNAPPRPADAFGVWTFGGGFMAIRGGTPTCISGDGWTVGGFAPRVGLPGRNTAAIWYADRPMTRLALPPRGVGSQLFALSHDGEVGVGAYTTSVPGEVRAMVWIRSRGTRDLTELLASLGVSPPPGVKLRTATRVSADGTRIAGLAAGPGGQVLVYRATLPPALVCYANCDGSLGVNPLNAADMACFTQRLAAGHFYADCNRDGVTNAADMSCFLARFRSGCPR